MCVGEVGLSISERGCHSAISKDKDLSKSGVNMSVGRGHLRM